MRIGEYLKTLSPDERERFAADCDTSVDYLYQLAGEHRSPSLGLAQTIEKRSNKAVTLYDWPIVPTSAVAKRPHRKQAKAA